MPAININSVTIDRFYKYSTYQESIIQGTLVLGLIVIGIIIMLCVFGALTFDDAKINAVFLTSTIAFIGLSMLNYISDRKSNMLEPFIIYTIESKKEKNRSAHNNQINLIGDPEEGEVRRLSVRPSDLKRSNAIDFNVDTAPEDDILKVVQESTVKNITVLPKELDTLTEEDKEDSGKVQENKLTSVGPSNGIELTPVEQF